MLAIVRSILPVGLMLISTLPLRAQTPPNSAIRPSTDSSVTTGIGTGSTFRNVPPPDQSVIDRSHPFHWDTPEANEKPAPDAGAAENDESSKAAPAPPAEKDVEDPRTTITRDRIESPQHQ